MYKLVISDDEGKTTVVPLVRDEITIGRKEGNTIRLTERNVSRRHARLRKADGAFRIEDLGSYNGIKINGHRVQGEVELGAGDQISIGDYQLAVQMDGVDAPTAETTAAVAAPISDDAATALIAAPSAEPVPPARIVMLSPPAPGAEFALSRPRVRIGRAEDLDVWVNHRSISREHAEITREGDRFHLRDLGSANGMRLNGAEVKDAVLEAGDTMELGQVRFRFVGEGESYVFDADRTIQVDSSPGQRGSRAPIFAAVGIVVVAIVVAAALALSNSSGQSTEPVVTSLPLAADHPSAAQAPSNPAPAPVPVQTGQPETGAVQACNTALAAGQIDVALRQSAAALRIAPDSEPAQDCKRRAKAAQTYETGRAQLNKGDSDGAYNTFDGLPDNSPYRQKPEVGQATQAYAQHRIDDAHNALPRDPAAAERYAGEVLAMSAVPTSLRREASRIQHAARRVGAVATADTGHHVSHVTHVHHPPPEPDHHSTTTTTTVAQSTTVEPSHPASGGGGQVCDPGDMRYTQCIIRTFGGGRARSPHDLALLIASYRQAGNMPKALQSMKEFVQRYPTQQQAYQYRQILARHPH